MMCWSYPLPRALPWAIIFKPFGLNNVIHIATKGGQSLNAWGPKAIAINCNVNPVHGVHPVFSRP